MTTLTPSPEAESLDLRFGANYVPSQGWFYSWLDLDRSAVTRDLADLAALGMDHVRIFPVWPWIQPGRGHLRHGAIEDVRTVVQEAASHGLDVCVDLLQGHLSSFDFLPSWVLTSHDASVFTSLRVRDGLRDYLSAMVEALAVEPNVFAFTLGNEVNNLWPTNPTTIQESRTWASDLVDTVRAHARPDQQVVYSLFDDAFYAPDHPFTVADVVQLGELSSVHSWVFNGTSRIDGPLGPATVSHAAYLAELAVAAGDPGRSVWLQEVGVPMPDVPVEDAAEFVRRTVEALSVIPQLSGVTWWCSHDIDRAQLDFPDREYDLGLFTTDHVAKPAAHALREAIAAVNHQRRQAEHTAVQQQRALLTAPVDILAAPQSRDLVAPGSAFHAEWVRHTTRPDGRLVPARIQLRP